MRALALLLCLVPALAYAEPRTPAPTTVTVPVELTPEMCADLDAVVISYRLQGKVTTPAELVREAVVRYCAEVRALNLRERERQRTISAALKHYHRRLDRDLDAAAAKQREAEAAAAKAQP